MRTREWITYVILSVMGLGSWGYHVLFEKPQPSESGGFIAAICFAGLLVISVWSLIEGGDASLSVLVAETEKGIRALKRAQKLIEQSGTTGRRITGTCLDGMDLALNFEDKASIERTLGAFERYREELRNLQANPRKRFGPE